MTIKRKKPAPRPTEAEIEAKFAARKRLATEVEQIAKRIEEAGPVVRRDTRSETWGDRHRGKATSISEKADEYYRESIRRNPRLR